MSMNYANTSHEKDMTKRAINMLNIDAAHYTAYKMLVPISRIPFSSSSCGMDLVISRSAGHSNPHSKRPGQSTVLQSMIHEDLTFEQ